MFHDTLVPCAERRNINMRKIRIEELDAQRLVQEVIAKAITSIGLTPEKLQMEINPNVKLKEEEKIEIAFSEMAEKKMYYLIHECEKEIGWHGLVSRSENGFYVEDIIVFPQEVTGATVTSDDELYPTWMLSQPDEIYNKIRFHGHSHVNMATSPSGVDDTYQEQIIQQFMSSPVDENNFYIFGIFNKKGSYWLNIYDIYNNKFYETDDISYVFYQSDEQAWAKEQIKENVKEEVVVKTSGYYSNGYGYRGGGYGTEELYDSWKKNYDKNKGKEKPKKDEAELRKELSGAIIADLTPPKWHSKWSKCLQRMISCDESLDDLIEEYCITYPDYSGTKKK